MRQMLLVQRGGHHHPRPADTSAALAPTGLGWSSPDPGTLVLTWTPGSDPDSAILRHEYQIDGGQPVPADGPDGTTITGLTRRTTYTVGVRTVSAGGPSEWASVQATTVYALTLPGFPAALDDVHADMRPQTGVTWTATVAKDGTGDYASVAAAAKAAHEATPIRTPATRALIFVKPGTYPGLLVELHDWTGVVGTTGNPADVIIENVTSATEMNSETGGRGAVDTWGATHVENVTCRRVNTDAPSGQLSNPKYTVHGTSGTCCLWANVIFDYGQSTNGLGMPSVFGQDGGDGNYTLFYRCRFIGSRADADTNIHAGPGNGPGETLAYVSCTWETTGIADTTPGLPPAGSFGYKPMSDTRKGDHCWVVDCPTVPTINMPAAAGAILHNPGQRPLSRQTNVGTIDTRADWPKPVDWRLS